MNRIRLAGALLGAAILGLGIPAAAQMYGPPPGPPGGPGMSGGYGQPPYGQPQYGQPPYGQSSYGPPSEASVEQNLASLHSRLSVTPQQEPAWQGFAGAVRQQTQQVQSVRGTLSHPGATAPQRLDQMAQLARQRAAGMTAVAQAMTKLYAVLDANQRSMIDEEFAAPPPPGMAGGPPPR
ncbi:MAG TPA: Spy/CpxP family protein refolding chaperone [Usitatibacter sp.]|nr:Spy/CpxP family protein refolding chaperone [Usitatibacter sp.]